MKKIAFLFCLCFSVVTAQVAQTVWESNEVKRPVPLPYVREADVAWSKRVWRVIDLREKFNLPYYYPLYPTAGCSSLFDVFKNGIFAGKINAYSPNDDEFAHKYSVDEVKKKLVKIDTSIFYESDTYGVEHEIKTIINDTVSSAEVIQYWVKEDFFFDTRRSVLDVRIIGICPVKYDKEKEMYIPLFWIYFNECRPLLSSAVAFNERNDKERRTFDDLFLKRKFHSYITKESNVYDRSISSYAKGLDGLMESEKIKNDLRNFECDLWEN